MLFSSFDLPIQRALTSMANLSPSFDHVVALISALDLFKGEILFSLLWFVWFDQRNGSQQTVTSERGATLSTYFGTLFAVGIARLLQKQLPVHPRPFHMDLGLTFPTAVMPDSFNKWNSFPSDHAVYFAALATGLYFLNKKVGIFAFLWTLLIVCLPRLYLGIHHPSDVVAGLLIGTLLMLAWRKGVPKRPFERLVTWGEKHAAIFYCSAFLITLNAAHLFDEIRTMGGELRDYLFP